MCVVGLNAEVESKSYVLAEQATEKLIVRASNPGQFDQDDIQWQRSHMPDAIYHQVSCSAFYQDFIFDISFISSFDCFFF